MWGRQAAGDADCSGCWWRHPVEMLLLYEEEDHDGHVYLNYCYCYWTMTLSCCPPLPCCYFCVTTVAEAACLQATADTDTLCNMQHLYITYIMSYLHASVWVYLQCPFRHRTSTFTILFTEFEYTLFQLHINFHYQVFTRVMFGSLTTKYCI